MMGGQETAVPNAPAGATSGIAPKVIHTGQVALEVDDVKRAERGVRELAERNGGYVSDASMGYAEGGGSGGTLTLKVPADTYPATYAELTDGTLGHLLRGEEKADDVTEEWVDVDTRIRVLSDQRDQMRELLKRRGDLSEILQIQREILNLQTQIESAQGRLRYLQNRVELSTITVELRLRADESQLLRAEREAGKWMPLRVLQGAMNLLVRMLQAFANVLIYVGTLFPCWAPPAFLVWLIHRRMKRARSAG
jgi:hypothetical protein